MKRSVGLLVLLSLLVLAACSETPEVGTAPDNAANVASFQFDIDPAGEDITVTQLEPAALGTQQFTQLDPETQLRLKNARYIFGANNTLTIKATFTNVTSNTNFLQPFSFGPVTSPQTGNYQRSTEPRVTDADLGGDGVLSPGETTSTLTFTVKHKGERFLYIVQAFAVTEPVNPGGCGADGVVESNVTIQTQADIDALRGCTRIEGSLIVGTDASTLDFSPLSSLQTIVRSFLVERNPNLTSISGFDNLRTVATFPTNDFELIPEFTIRDNPSLVSVSGFGGLEEVGGFGLDIFDNPSLVTVSGFGNLRRTTGLAIFENASLVSVAGFESLSDTGSFFVRNNPALTSIPAFGALERANSFFLENNDALVSFSGFGELELVLNPFQGGGGLFSISNNDALESFSGFENLRLAGSDSIDSSGSFLIENNPSLVSIPEFGSLEAVTGDDFLPSSFSISNNASLLEVTGFGELNRVDGGSVTISDNASLTAISGFTSLTFIPPGDEDDFVRGSLSISNNDSLTSISGFAPLPSSEPDGQIVTSQINDNDVFDCSVPPQSNLPFLPVNESVGNLVNCPVKGPFFESNAIVRTQAELDALEGVDRVGGDLLIFANEMLDFSPLDDLETVIGTLRISSDVLTSVSGFGSLESVGVDVDISENLRLTSISGFGQLANIGGGFVSRNNGALTSISGFGQLADVEVLVIDDNAMLTSVSGFGSLSSGSISDVSRISGNTVFDCSAPPQSNLPFLPVDESTGNLVNCPTE